MKLKPALLFITWLGAAVRWRGLFANTFHADEALFASWARLIGLWRDPLLQTVGVVDKPPLLFYMQGLFYPILGQVEWAARLPNFIAGLVLIPLTAVLAYQLTADRRASLTAALLVALSPLAIQFTPTAFTDPLMTTLVMAGLVAAVAKRPSWAGWWLGLAVATKYQAVLFVPLVLWGAGEQRSRGAEETYYSLLTTHFLPFTFYFLLPISLTLAWDYSRTGSLSLWQAQMASYGGVRLAWSWELWPRLLAWGELGWFVLGWGWLLVIRYWLFSIPHSASRIPQSPFLPLFLLTYLLLHWLLAIPVWDRYLLPIVPLAAVWVAGGVAGEQGSRGAGGKERKSGRELGFFTTYYSLLTTHFLLLTFYLLLLSSAYPARLGRWPIGGQPTADGGAAQLAQELVNAPYGTVLYDHWYSWHWRYHFIDTGVYVSWFPHPAGLVEDVAVFGTDGRYLILPVDGRATPVLRTLHEAHIATHPIAAAGEMVLYQLAMNNEQ